MSLPELVPPVTDPHGGRPSSADIDTAGIPSRGRVVLRRFARRRHGVAGLAVLLAMFLLAFVGPRLSRWDYQTPDFGALLQAPSGTHWFGTTQIGLDVYTHTLRGMQKSLFIGLLVAVFSTGLAALAGTVAGYFGGWADRSVRWLVDLLLVIPSFLIVAVLSPWFKGGSWLLFVALLAAFMWMITARIVRGMTLSLKEHEYVLAARYMGVSGPRIIVRHILPNLASVLIVDATLNVSAAVLAETGLSYFGFGVQPPDVSLGTLIATGTGSAVTYPWLFLFPAGMLVALVLSVNLVGDALRDAIDPTSVRGR